MKKSKRKEILKAIKEKELAEFRQNLPMSEDKFIRLFELLDAELHVHGCDHGLKTHRANPLKFGSKRRFERACVA